MILVRYALKSIAGARIRFVLTTLAVVIGVSFTVGVFITTDGLRSTFDDLSQDIFEGVDLSVRSQVEFGDRTLDAPLVDPALEEVVRSVDGVAAAEGGVFEINVVPIKADGESLDSFGPPQMGVSWPDDSQLSQLTVWPDGMSRPPRGPDEFALDADTARENGFEIGERYRISTPTGTQAFTLVGYFRFGTSENATVGAQISAWDRETAQKVLHGNRGFDSIDIRLEPGASKETTAASITAALAAQGVNNLEVVPNEMLVEEQTDEFGEVIGFFQNFLLGFAIVILVVSAFIIYNTFTIIIGQRIRELGLLRALGASGRQISQTVVGEAIVVGLVSTGLGLVGGVGLAVMLRAIFNAIGLDLPDAPIVVGSRTVIAAFAIGVGVTLVSAIWPALKARRVVPMAALAEDARLSASEVHRAPWLGGLLIAAAVAVVALGISFPSTGLIVLTGLAGPILMYTGGVRLHPFAGRVGVLVLGVALLTLAILVDLSTGNTLALLGMGALSVFLGMNLLSPTFAGPVALLLGGLPARVFGISGNLSRLNAARNPGRTSSTASALMIGLALVSMVTVLGQSFKQTLSDTLDDSVSADWLICVGNCNNEFAAFSPAAAQAMSERAELESVVSYRAREGSVRTPTDGDEHTLFSTDLDVFNSHLDPDIVAGSLAGAGSGDIVVLEDEATERGIQVGDRVELEFVGGRRANFEVVALFADDTILGSPWVIDNRDWDTYLSSSQDQFLSAVTAPGFTAQQARAALESVTAEYPQLEIRDQAEFLENQESQIDNFLMLVNVFLGISLVIALMGIANTLALSVFERTRELGLLRAVGMTRRQTRRMIRWEGAIVSTFGGLLGTVVGVLFAWAAVQVIPSSFISVFAVPWTILLIYLAGAALAGLVAASFPARRAGRLNVLDAIAHQ
ncbi:ABC transporter permease [Candidatus Poriferisocius sp.]|uniref:ABC transporter permease n=1 Tax=Candidatus Poriferisocius sp. TaxID=3101276 RepID=UPI003B026113